MRIDFGSLNLTGGISISFGLSPTLEALVRTSLLNDNAVLSDIGRKVDEILKRENQIMATQQDFQTKIDTINANTTASAKAAQAVAGGMADLRKKLDDALTNAGVPADQEKAILDQLDSLAGTSSALQTFLEQTAAAPSTEPEPVPVPAPVPVP